MKDYFLGLEFLLLWLSIIGLLIMSWINKKRIDLLNERIDRK